MTKTVIATLLAVCILALPTPATAQADLSFPDWERLYRPWWDGMTDQGRRDVFSFCNWYYDASGDTQLSYFNGNPDKTIAATLSCFWISRNRSWLVGEQPDILGR